jgi:3-hydroxypropanoate dehydrogenase
MVGTINESAEDVLFRDARTHHAWLDRPVADETLHELYELMKWGPTSANSCPARILFLRTREQKERLIPLLAPGNVEQTKAAPVTAIVAHDLLFYDQLPKLSPHSPGFRDYFAKDAALAETSAFRNGSLQGGYFILAARAVGLDCGPMSGFDNARVDEEFFRGKGAGLAFPSGDVRSNFLCNLGYGDAEKLHPRAPRLAFEDACALL